ncbi:MAG: helix-turn-helix domain-containing protein [Chloroflexi bacterium]|nr:helix-turn-helix domain-containing protein [Chloroflexota bacterium]
MRESLGLKKAEMGRLAGVASQTLYNGYEAGKVVPTIPFLVALYQETGVNLVWLLTGEGEMMGMGRLTDREMELLDCYRRLPEERQEVYYHRMKADAIEAGLGQG